MLYPLLIALFTILCFVIILIVLMQKGKSSMGLGGLGGGTQLLFGGSGGQDLFQKVTWILGALFMAGSLLLAIIKRPTTSHILKNIAHNQPVPVMPMQHAQTATPPAQEAAKSAEQSQTTP